MKKTSLTISIALFLSFSAYGALTAQEKFSWAAEQVRLVLEGDSTLHPYASTATIVNVSFNLAVPTAEAFVSFKGDPFHSLEIEIPVEKMESGKKGLDKKMAKELKADEYPLITFKESKTMLQVSPDQASLVSHGVLSVGGEDREIDLPAMFSAENGKLKISGKKELLMSSFAIDPPQMFLGAVKTDDKVTIRYEMILVPEAN